MDEYLKIAISDSSHKFSIIPIKVIVGQGLRDSYHVGGRFLKLQAPPFALNPFGGLVG